MGARPPVALYRVDAPHFVAGFELSEGGMVTYTAPILCYMQGWLLGRVKSYCLKKGWALGRVFHNEQVQLPGA